MRAFSLRTCTRKLFESPDFVIRIEKRDSHYKRYLTMKALLLQPAYHPRGFSSQLAR